MTTIRYQGRIVAEVSATHARIADSVGAALEPGHPVRRFVAGMCVLAMQIEEGNVDGPYTDQRAALVVRSVTMPIEEFEALSGLADHELAEHFNVPLEQVELHRETVAAGTGRRAGRGLRSAGAGA